MFRDKQEYTVLVFLLVLTLLFAQVQLVSATSFSSEIESWWNTNWRYRRRIDIVENSGYSLTNFPVEVIFEHSGKVQPDGDDIRVVIGGVEVISYVSNLNRTHAKVMFEVNVTASSTKTVYIYYGNPKASKPNYPLVPLIIQEGNTGYAIIDNLVYIGWDYTSWGWSNKVVLWNDFRIDFNGNNDPRDDEDMITDYGSRQGGIGRHRRDIQAIGLGSYQNYVQTPMHVDINFAGAKLRVYRNNPWVETAQADFLFMFSPSWDYAKYGGGTEQNIIDGLNINIIFPTQESIWNALYFSKANPGWMAYRNSKSGYIFASTGLRIGKDYAYFLYAKEASAWDRTIHYFKGDPKDYPLEPYDQPLECRIYWYGDDGNNYLNIEKMARIFNNPPSIFVAEEELRGSYIVIDQSFVSDERADVGSTQAVGFHARWDNGSDVNNGLIYVKEFRILPTTTFGETILFHDDFDEDVSDRWIEHLGRWSVVDGKYFVSVGVVENGISTVKGLNIEDCIIETKLRFTDAVGYRAGIVFRYIDNKHYYSFEIGNEYDEIDIIKYSPENPGYGEKRTVIQPSYGNSSIVIKPNVDYILKIQIQGNMFTAYLNGQKVLSWTDDSYQSGGVGLRARRADVYFDYFTVYSTDGFKEEVKIEEYSTNSTGWVFLNVTSSDVARDSWTVSGVNVNGVEDYLMEVKDPSIIWDQVNVTIYAEDNRIDIGKKANITCQAVYEYDGEPLLGSVFLNDTVLSQDYVGRRGYKARKILDEKYGLTKFTTDEVFVIWDRVNVTLNISNLRIEVGSTANLTWMGFYEYDGEPFSGIITLNDTLTKNVIGKYGYKVASIVDPKYGLEAFTTNEVYCIFDRIKETFNFETTYPGSIRVTVKLEYLYDGAPVEDAIVRINGLAAKHLKNGIYETVLPSWMPYLNVNIEIERVGFKLILKGSTVYSLGNILSETSIITVLVLIAGLKLNAKRAEKKRWLIKLEKLEELVKEKGRIELSEVSSILNVEISEVKALLSELMNDKRIIGTFTSDSKGFVTEEKLREELIRRVREREE